MRQFSHMSIMILLWMCFSIISAWDNAATTLRKHMTKGSAVKSEKEILLTRRVGVEVDTQVTWGGGGNKQPPTANNPREVDPKSVELKHDTVPLDLGNLIQQARQNKGMSQQDLATKINEKTQVVNDYETSRSIPNQMVIGKMEKVLGMKLRGKDRGTPLLSPKWARK